MILMLVPLIKFESLNKLFKNMQTSMLLSLHNIKARYRILVNFYLYLRMFSRSKIDWFHFIICFYYSFSKLQELNYRFE